MAGGTRAASNKREGLYPSPQRGRYVLGIFGSGKTGTTSKCGLCGHKMVDVSAKSPMELIKKDVHTGYKCVQCEQSYCDCRDLIMLTCKCGARSWMAVAYVS